VGWAVTVRVGGCEKGVALWVGVRGFDLADDTMMVSNQVLPCTE
jgi:hypothetical protein